MAGTPGARPAGRGRGRHPAPRHPGRARPPGAAATRAARTRGGTSAPRPLEPRRGRSHLDLRPHPTPAPPRDGGGRARRAARHPRQRCGGAGCDRHPPAQRGRRARGDARRRPPRGSRWSTTAARTPGTSPWDWLTAARTPPPRWSRPADSSCAWPSAATGCRNPAPSPISWPTVGAGRGAAAHPRPSGDGHRAVAGPGAGGGVGTPSRRSPLCRRRRRHPAHGGLEPVADVMATVADALASAGPGVGCPSCPRDPRRSPPWLRPPEPPRRRSAARAPGRRGRCRRARRPA